MRDGFKMPLIRRSFLEAGIFVAVFVSILVPLYAWLHQFSSSKISENPEHWAHFAAYLSGTWSPVLAFVSFVMLLLTLRLQRAEMSRQEIQADDRRYFDHAVSSMERAYDSLSLSNQSVGPVKDRLAWLTCARLLISAQRTSRNISSQSIGLRLVYEGEVEHWRRRFYELFHAVTPPVGWSAMYFFDAHNDGEDLDERSVRVVFDFVAWPTGQLDSIDEVPRFSAEELAALSVSMVGVRNYFGKDFPGPAA